MIHAESGFSLTGYKVSSNLSFLFRGLPVFSYQCQMMPVPTRDLDPGHLAVNAVPWAVMFGEDFGRKGNS